MKSLKFVVIFIPFWFSVIFNVWGASLETESQDCINCSVRKSTLPLENLRQLRLGYVKQQILKKLQLSEPPKMNLPKPYLKPLLLSIAEIAENETKDENDDLTKRESVVIYPKEENVSCIGTEIDPCTRFDFVLTDNLSLDDFLSAEVWLFRRDLKKSLLVSQVVIDPRGNIDKTLKLKSDEDDESKESWIKFNVPHCSFKSNLTKDQVFTLQISYSVDNSTESLVGTTGEEKPFLIIRGMKFEGSSRTRRSTVCEEDASSCCREHFYLNFSEIGWDNWILHPDGYDANFCRGRCFNDLSSTRFYHSAVLLSYIGDNKDIAEEIGLSMCCTPSAMSPVSIIYRDEKGLIFRRSLENMRVDSCDCA